MASKEKEDDKKVPLTQKEAEIRRSLVSMLPEIIQLPMI